LRVGTRKRVLLTTGGKSGKTGRKGDNVLTQYRKKSSASWGEVYFVGTGTSKKRKAKKKKKKSAQNRCHHPTLEHEKRGGGQGGAMKPEGDASGLFFVGGQGKIKKRAHHLKKRMPKEGAGNSTKLLKRHGRGSRRLSP